VLLGGGSGGGRGLGIGAGTRLLNDGKRFQAADVVGQVRRMKYRGRGSGWGREFGAAPRRGLAD
jgi:hypothetical protein